MATPAFGITWDYRCPFAAKAHDHVVEGLRGGADWDVTFVPMSLGQLHVEEGGTDVWDDPGRDTGLLALQAGVAVRDLQPDRFLDVHRGLFDARHVHGRLIADEDVVRDVLAGAGADEVAVFDEIAAGTALATIRKEHEAAVADFGIWGVPTFIVGADAVFVRLMEGAHGDADQARRTVERIVGLVGGWPELNEFKHTRIPR